MVSSSLTPKTPKGASASTSRIPAEVNRTGPPACYPGCVVKTRQRRPATGHRDSAECHAQVAPPADPRQAPLVPSRNAAAPAPAPPGRPAFVTGREWRSEQGVTEPVAHRPPLAPWSPSRLPSVRLPQRPCVWAWPACCPLLAGPADDELQRAGQHPLVLGADGPLRVAVLGDGQLDGDVAVGVRFDDDLPPDVAGRVQPPGPDQSRLSPWTPWTP